MKPLYYITITTSSLIFLGCTPMQNISQPKRVIQTTAIETTSPSLGKAIKRAKSPKKKKTPTKVKRPTKTKKEPVELIEPSHTTEIKEKEPTTPKVAEITSIKEASKVDEYGNPPKNYRDTIRKYLSKRADRGDSIKFVFSRPYKAQKNNKSWKGWAVEVDMLKRNGEGRVLRNKPYTILFNGSSIVEDLSEDKAKSVTKVVY